MPWYERLQTIDNRWLYLALAVAVAIPVFVKFQPPIPPTMETLGVYEAVESLPPGRLVMILSAWDAGTIGECEGQFHALIEHLMRRNIPFVVWTSIPTGPPFYSRVIAEAAKKYGRVYGRDWADFGYKAPGGSLAFAVQSMARDFPAYMKTDVNGTPAERLPVMQGVKDATSFGLVVSIGYNPVVEFIQFIQAVYGTKVACGIAAIMATTTYTYIDSKQIVGMLVGARGGAEYETLLKAPGKGVEIIIAQSFGHLLIILAVLTANIAFLAGRRAQRRREAAL